MKHKVIARCFDKRGRLISEATNSYVKSHPEQKRLASLVGEPYKQYLHAEVAAIIKAKKPVYKISVSRHNSNGESRLALPCAICQLAIKQAGITVVEYTV